MNWSEFETAVWMMAFTVIGAALTIALTCTILSCGYWVCTKILLSSV